MNIFLDACRRLGLYTVAPEVVSVALAEDKCFAALMRGKTVETMTLSSVAKLTDVLRKRNLTKAPLILAVSPDFSFAAELPGLSDEALRDASRARLKKMRPDLAKNTLLTVIACNHNDNDAHSDNNNTVYIVNIASVLIIDDIYKKMAQNELQVVTTALLSDEYASKVFADNVSDFSIHGFLANDVADDFAVKPNETNGFGNMSRVVLAGIFYVEERYEYFVRVTTKARRLNKSLLTKTIAAVCASVMLIVGIYDAAAVRRAEDALAAEELRERFLAQDEKTVSSLQKNVASIAKMRGEMTEIAKGQLPLSALFAYFGAVIPEGVRLNGVEVLEDGAVIIEGVAMDGDALNRFLTALTGEFFSSAVTAEDVAAEGNIVHFRLRANL